MCKIKCQTTVMKSFLMYLCIFLVEKCNINLRKLNNEHLKQNDIRCVRIIFFFIII